MNTSENPPQSKEISSEITLNLTSPTILCNQLIKQYSSNEKLILNISSGAAKNPICSWSCYCITKSGLDMLSMMLKKENPEKLEVFSVSPGVVDTNMQVEIRNSDKKYFPLHQKFIDYNNNNELMSTESTSLKIYKIIENTTNFSTRYQWLLEITAPLQWARKSKTK